MVRAYLFDVWWDGETSGYIRIRTHDQPTTYTCWLFTGTKALYESKILFTYICISQNTFYTHMYIT